MYADWYVIPIEEKNHKVGLRFFLIFSNFFVVQPHGARVQWLPGLADWARFWRGRGR